jgi:hypothetical protein
LIIRNEQTQSLDDAGRSDFITRVIAHLNELFPERCAVLGPAEVRATVELGMQRGWKYGLDNEYDLVRYIDHMYVLGPDFDTDPRYPWAASILSDPGLASRSKMDWLSGRTRQELPGRS